MLHVNWIINLLVRTSPILGLLLAVVPGLVSGGCPRELPSRAHTCFANYSVRFQSLQRSTKKLCCGVDVETLRAFCRAYVDGVRCVSRLKGACPPEKHHMIDNALVNLDGAREALTGLCSDDTLIERYAMYQSCFTMAGPESEACFRTHLEGHRPGSGVSSNIRFLSKVTTSNRDMGHFCSKMKATVSCIQTNVLHMCGSQAAALAAVLSKPMVRHSTDCDYTVAIARNPQDPTRSHQGNAAYISDGHSPDTGSSSGNHGNNNRGGSRGNGGRNSNTQKRGGPDGGRNEALNIKTSSSCIALTALFVTLFSKILGICLW